MATGMTAPWTVATETGAPTRIVVTVQLADAGTDTAAARDALLSDGIVDLVAALVRTATGSTAVAVDLRCDTDGPEAVRAVEAFVAAVRGLVQSFVLERSAPAGPVNLVVSTSGQDGERDVTWRYLGSADGGFSWGACYDLREETA